MPIGYEARCTKCGDHFNPQPPYPEGSPYPLVTVDDGLELDMEHWCRDDGTTECGGLGELVGSWG